MEWRVILYRLIELPENGLRVNTKDKIKIKGSATLDCR